MNEILQSWLDHRLGESSPDASLSFRFATSPAPWIMLAGGVAALFAVVITYRREPLSDLRRRLLMFLRFGAIMTALFICGGPLIVLSRNRIERSYVALVIDRSASMGAVDGPSLSDSADGRAVALSESRWDHLKRSLCVPEHGLLAKLADRAETGVWVFGETAEQRAEISGAQSMKDFTAAMDRIEPTGTRTNLGRALRKVLRDTLGRRLAAVVLISDGRQTEPVELDEVLADLAGRRVGVVAVGAGSPKTRRDLSLVSAWAPREVFVADTVDVELLGRAAGVEKNTTLTLELADEADRRVLATSQVTVSEDSDVIRGRLRFRPPRSGRIGLIARLVPLEQEERTDNNETPLVITASEDMPGVLFVESVPRFEYRYLKNLLLRERSIKSSCLLLDSSVDFPQEGSLPIRRFPRSVEELRPYDVIILGDVDPGRAWLNPAQQGMISDFVSVQGGGVIFLAGERFMPAALRGTELEKLLPVSLASVTAMSVETPATFRLELTPDGRRSPVFRLDPDDERNDLLVRAFPAFHWSYRALEARPGAIVLARQTQASAPALLAVQGRYGAGRTFFLGTDELWRWRRNGGDVYYDAIWLQLIRTMGRDKALVPDSPWRIETDRRQYEAGDPVQIRLTCVDPTTTETTRASQTAGTDLAEVPVAVLDLDDVRVAEVVLRTEPGDAPSLTGSFVPPRAGNLVLRATPTAIDRGRAAETVITVSARDPERAVLEADFDLMKMVADRTDGAFFTLEADARQIAGVIPDRSVQIADDVEIPLWDNGYFLALFGVLIVAEWALRRARGLA